MQSPGFPLAVVVALMAFVNGCGDESSDGAVSDSCASTKLDSKFQDTMTLTPNSASPGEVFTVKYPSPQVRSENVFMSRLGESECGPNFLLSADEGGTRWSPITGDEGAVIGFPRERSSHPAVVPDVAPPGTYRICDESLEACAVLTVTK
jgi:hypothetical protein